MKRTFCKVLVPTSGVGIGIEPESLNNGVNLKPDVIACDAGSTDSGPYYLGTGKPKYSDDSVKEDMRLMIKASNKLGIPILIGTAGTCGVDNAVDWMKNLCQEICNDIGMNAKIAGIYSQQNKITLKKKYREGSVHPLASAPSITEDTFEECSNIVALAGVEPYIEALKNGADIVIGGRTTDTAMLACVPIMKGCNIGSSWHAAKIAECGPLSTTNPLSGGVIFSVDDKGFSIQPTSDNAVCTPYTVSSHMLYENSDPHFLREPSGTLNAEKARYTQMDNQTVRVEGSEFIPTDQYTLKLEGSGPVGYQTIILVGVQDPYTLSKIEQWKEKLLQNVSHKLQNLGYSNDDYSVDIKLYGYNAVSGESFNSDNYVPREVGVLFTSTGTTQEIATKIAKVFNPVLLHFSIEDENEFPSHAFSSSPADIEKGEIYEFKLNHVVETDNPFELINIKYWNE